MRITSLSRRFDLPILVLLTFIGIGHGQTTWDNGANLDKNWSAAANWTTDASPAGMPVVFGNTGTGNSSTVGNIVDQSFTINSLSYINAATGTTTWQVTQIAPGTTLTIDSGAVSGTSFRVGGFTTGTSSLVAITGSDAAFVVSATSAMFTVSNGGSNSARAILDMSGLGSFTAAVNSFNIGTGNQGYGTVYLSDTSLITSSTLVSGGASTNYNSTVSNFLYLGADTTLNVDTIALATGRTPGQALFRSGITNGQLKIRGADGVSRAALSVGDLTEGGVYNPTANNVSVLDLSRGSVDALVSTLTVGSARRGLNGTNSYTGRMIVVSGTLDATSVVIGRQAGNTADGAATATMRGNLQISGGSITAGSILLAQNTAGVNNALTGTLDISGSANVHVAGDVTLAQRTAGSNSVSATVNMSAGTLLINGNLTEGAGSNLNSTVNLSGGTVNMDHGNIFVDSFSFTGGVLRDVASFTAGTTGGLNLQNNAALAFGLDGGFVTLSLTGTMSLDANSGLVLSLANGFTPGANITLISNDNGGDFITGTFATINGSSFGAGDTFTLTNDLGSFAYELSYTGGDGNDLVAIAVPEPSACLLIGFGCAAALWRRRPRD